MMNYFEKRIISIVLSSSLAISSCVYIPDSSTKYKDMEELVSLIQHGIKYILNDFWTEERQYAYGGVSNKQFFQTNLTSKQIEEVLQSQKSFVNWQNEEYLKIIIPNGDAQENSIRPFAHACHIIAIALKYNLYDETSAGFSFETTKKMTIKLIISLAKNHLANNADGWGCTWQSALWAELIGSAAWIIKDDIPEVGMSYIENMVLLEAERFIDYEVPYYMNVAGEILYPGDTKGEENAWNQRILALACCMFPEDSRLSLWENKLIEMMLSSTATPEDLCSNEVVDGVNISNILCGSNFNSNGTVVNHRRYHIDYMVSPSEGLLESVALLGLANKRVPHAALHNLDKIYSALVYFDLGTIDNTKKGHHFYERNDDGGVSSLTNMPGKNDWGSMHQANYYLMDTAAELFDLDNNHEDKLKAELWAHERINQLTWMADRKSNVIESGKFYEDGEDNNVSGDVFVTDCLVQAYLLRVLQYDRKIRFNT